MEPKDFGDLLRTSLPVPSALVVEEFVELELWEHQDTRTGAFYLGQHRLMPSSLST